MNTQGLKTARKLIIFQILTAFLASGAFIPTTIPSTSVISNSAAAINNTSNSSLTAQPFCVVPPGRYIDISIRACQPALNRLMQEADPSSPIEFHWFGHAIKLTGAPCIISLECAEPSSDLTLSAREIVGYAYSIVVTCKYAGAGWVRIDEAEDWLVTVVGAAGHGIVNAINGETGNTSLLEDRGE